ncbi:molybdopterin-guanine dinucleotide biosynthesis protein A [Sphingomonas endophytica]|uniref:Molybdenum cofactor guanylyltransferase n=1 Tax=Sphingomonas endophytica TaxID=869719 RepID=A0A7X0JB89_9SPHN|nr:molybdenum cofactor guanylyltransferase [Sphingomonas endophytica]MBB6504434.1 molybdopterin-guanine dinucleotide biosynthesis protein A [Sphingomonas endophytica]
MIVLGAVLAGGRATRFGSDKALAALGGRALLDHAIASLAAHCDTIVVVGRPEAPVTCIPDLPRSDLGPLGGIAGALAYATDHGFDAVLTTACDTPFLPDAVVAALRAAAPAYAAEAPTVGLWPAHLAGALLAHLLADQPRAVRRWAATIGAAAILPGMVLANINTPDDLTNLSSSRT